MERGAGDMGLASHRGDGPGQADRGPRGVGLTPGDLDAARELAEFHRLLAADLPSDSRVRGLLLRCAGHWSRLGAIPRNGLTGVDRGED